MDTKGKKIMRLLEIKISCYDRKKSEIVGDDDYDNDEPSRSFIDLDKVSSVWENPDTKSICIHVGSHQESYWTTSFALDEFVYLWKGDTKSKLEKLIDEVNNEFDGEQMDIDKFLGDITKDSDNAKI